MTSAAGSRRRSRATRREVVRALVVSPPLPGAGERVLTAETGREFWYQAFHQLALVEQILDGDRRRSAPTSRTSGATGPGRSSSRPTSASTISPASTARRARWPPRSAGTGPGRGWWPARSPRPSRGADRHADHRPVAERRPALPARVVGPARPLLQRLRAAAARRRRALHAAGGAAGVRRRDRRLYALDAVPARRDRVDGDRVGLRHLGREVELDARARDVHRIAAGAAGRRRIVQADGLLGQQRPHRRGRRGGGQPVRRGAAEQRIGRREERADRVVVQRPRPARSRRRAAAAAGQGRRSAPPRTLKALNATRSVA